MISIPINSLSQGKLSQLFLSVSDPPIYIAIEERTFDQEENTYFYTMEIGIEDLSSRTVDVHYVTKRYSSIYNFDREIRKAFKCYKFLLPFPPKKIFGNKNPSFIQKRQEQLQNYLSNLNRIPGLCETDSFKNCFEIN